jgi:hypothetical protein
LEDAIADVYGVGHIKNEVKIDRSG